MIFFICILYFSSHVIAGTYKKFGSESCPCVGIDVSGSKKSFPSIMINDTKSHTFGMFPSDLGTTCKAWDEGSNFKCSGPNPPQWCSQRWCFVDPCNCDLPLSTSTYLPSWKIRKKPLHFSYETCGGSGDSWFKETEIIPHVSAKCSEPESGVGSEACPCVGISGKPGHIDLLYNGRGGAYKVEIGSTCGLWESGAYPDCTTGREEDGVIPEWCSQRWCYVDPCNCKNIASSPRQTQKIAGSNIRGRPMYFSFSTCGDEYLLGDGWPEASCWTKTNPEECNSHANLKGQACGWLEGTGCIDGHLVELCEAPEPVLSEEKDEV